MLRGVKVMELERCSHSEGPLLWAVWFFRLGELLLQAKCSPGHWGDVAIDVPHNLGCHLKTNHLGQGVDDVLAWNCATLSGSQPGPFFLMGLSVKIS